MSQREPQGPQGPQPGQYGFGAQQPGQYGFGAQQPGQYAGSQQRQAAGTQEQRATGPVLRWVRLDSPGAMLPVDEDEEVLDTVFNPQFNAWEVLVRSTPEQTK